MGEGVGGEEGFLVGDVGLELEEGGLGLFLADFFGGYVRFDLRTSSVIGGV